MIKSIKLHNFQGHKDSTIALHPRVNAIVGESDAGKSSIIRFLKWVSTNRPVGDGYRNNSSASEEYGGTVTFDDISIERKKSKKVNSYTVEGVGELKALRTEIPREVESALRMNDINLQSQHDSYFLLQQSPGSVAKRLNELVDLDIIDFVLGEVNSTLRDTRRSVKAVEYAIDSTKGKIAEFDHLSRIERIVEKIETTLPKVDELKEKIEQINVAVQSIENAKEEIEEIDGWLKIEDSIAFVVKSVEEWKESSEKQNQLDTAISGIEDTKEKQKRCDLILTHNTTVNALLEAAEGYEVARKTKNGIVVCVNALNESMGVLKTTDENLDELKNEFISLLRSAKICPLCGKEMSKKDIEKHIEGML
jgi:DNA repair protein SbcC/Rad50